MLQPLEHFCGDNSSAVPCWLRYLAEEAHRHQLVPRVLLLLLLTLTRNGVSTRKGALMRQVLAIWEMVPGE